MKHLLIIATLFVWLLSAATAHDWSVAKPGYHFQFPRDHGSHPEFKIEWWYFTGNLKSHEGRQFGYQLTFFRIGVIAEPATTSPWALRDVWMAHAAVSDIKADAYHSADRLNRAGPGLAGATAEKIWNEDWRCTVLREGEFELTASDPKFSLQLKLKDRRPPVIHGENGISQKGRTQGNASHYYSLTHLQTEGTLSMGGESSKVTGDSWMDHEFGSSFLEPGQQGWDWFSARLSDGSALMVFQLRRQGAKDADASAGTLVRPDGAVIPLSSQDIRLTPGRALPSPAGDSAYPVAWQIDLPTQSLSLQCRALMPGQEFRAAATPGLNYWEGAVKYEGISAGRPITGEGYLEMTGYGGQAMTRWFGVGD